MAREGADLLLRVGAGSALAYPLVLVGAILSPSRSGYGQAQAAAVSIAVFVGVVAALVVGVQRTFALAKASLGRDLMAAALTASAAMALAAIGLRASGALDHHHLARHVTAATVGLIFGLPCGVVALFRLRGFGAVAQVLATVGTCAAIHVATFALAGKPLVGVAWAAVACAFYGPIVVLPAAVDAVLARLRLGAAIGDRRLAA